MSILVLVLIIILVLAALGGGYGYYGRAPGAAWPGTAGPYWYGGGIIWLILLVILILALAGRL